MFIIFFQWILIILINNKFFCSIAKEFQLLRAIGTMATLLRKYVDAGGGKGVEREAEEKGWNFLFYLVTK